MNFHRKLLERNAAGMPLRIAVIGAGKFGTTAGRVPDLGGGGKAGSHWPAGWAW